MAVVKENGNYKMHATNHKFSQVFFKSTATCRSLICDCHSLLAKEVVFHTNLQRMGRASGNAATIVC